MTFPLDSCPLRTDESFAQKQNEEHHQGPNPFQGLNVGMVSQFSGDYMHSVCLGVVRKLLNIWLRGAFKFRLPSSTVNRMSGCLTGLRSYIPLEFVRKPRTLRDLDRWKATEFRMFLLYIGPVILLSYLDKNIYQNVMLLFSSIKISTGDNTFVINGDICRVYNVVECTDATYIVYKRFSNKSVFFTYPFSSDFLNIFCLFVIGALCVCQRVKERRNRKQPSIRAILLCTTSTSTTHPSSDNLIFSTSTTRPSSDILILYTSTTHPASAILIFSTSTTLPFRAPLLFCTSS
ncbi:hypothetical protein N1851_012085 [Merluccius polli]|uniref:Uncharacterized protein n=1 Tax=Merluccius polli TaxID=89951 RepID=A0AA47MXY6_MERPO|nr:hypothetical protein N1851_012085 [Merluccius polli]